METITVEVWRGRQSECGPRAGGCAYFKIFARTAAAFGAKNGRITSASTSASKQTSRVGTGKNGIIKGLIQFGHLLLAVRRAENS